MFTMLASTDIDLDIGLIVSSLAPSILIIVTYYYSKRRTQENHNDTTGSLDTIKVNVNGQMAAALARITELEHRMEEVTRDDEM